MSWNLIILCKPVDKLPKACVFIILQNIGIPKYFTHNIQTNCELENLDFVLEMSWKKYV